MFTLLTAKEQIKFTTSTHGVVQSVETSSMDFTGSQGRNLTFSERSQVRQRCRKLLSLFRLVDFMIRDAVFDCVELNLSSLRTLLNKIQSDNDSMTSDTPLSMVRCAPLLPSSSVPLLSSYPFHSLFLSKTANIWNI